MTASATLPEALAQLAGDGPVLVCPDDNISFSVARLCDAAETLAWKLHALGIERGQRVALSLPNGPEIVVTLLALMRLGAAAAPLNTVYTPSEFRFYLEDLRPTTLLLPRGAGPAARKAAKRLVPITELEPREDGGIDLAHAGPISARSLELPNADDIALLLHTSGTTSRPKLVPLLHRNVMATTRSIVQHYRLRAGDRSCCAMPLFHVHGLLGSVFSALLAGGSVVVRRRVSRRTVLLDMVAHDVTWMSASPTVYHMLLEDDDEQPDSLLALRFLRSCSAALPGDLMDRVEDRFGVPMLEAYGMTEASHQISSNPLPPEERLPGSVGVATGTEIRILDPSWRELPVDELGEVAIRGSGLTPGYLDNEEANSESFRNGWFRTGDLGTLDSHGRLRLHGRLKEIIVRGGENISPHEVEQALTSHPAVADAVCFGVPDEKYGEVVAAAVTLRRPESERALIAHCRDRLAGFKAPHSIDVLDAIPRTATGKLQRARMANLLGKSESRQPA